MYYYFSPTLYDVLMIILWVVVIALVVSLVRYVMRGTKTDRRRNALDILNERYARGELIREEYEERKRAILMP